MKNLNPLLCQALDLILNVFKYDWFKEMTQRLYDVDYLQ